jgi:hypothetical protein
LVPDWNKTHGSLRICAGDLITQVNDLLEGDANAMCKEIQSGHKGSLLRVHVRTSVAGQVVARSEEARALVRTDAEARVHADSKARARAEAKAAAREEAKARAQEQAEALLEAREEARARAEAESTARQEAELVEREARTRAQREVEAARTRLCAENAERLRCELQSGALDSIPWDVENRDSAEAFPPQASESDYLRTESSPGYAAKRPVALDVDFDTSPARESDDLSEEDGMRVVIRYSPSKQSPNKSSPSKRTPCQSQEESLSREFSRDLFPLVTDQSPWIADNMGSGWVEVLRHADGNGYNEDMVSNASTDAPSGATTPALGGRRAAWV